MKKDDRERCLWANTELYKVYHVEEWGKRKLAYPINYENDGYYIVIDFTSDEAFPQELDRVINITDGVLRSLIVAKGE